jgi:hypothetical protein
MLPQGRFIFRYLVALVFTVVVVHVADDPAGARSDSLADDPEG